MAATLYFVRHGETDANVTDKIQGQTDIPLNARGIAQAKLVSERLKGMHFDAIYSSPLSRAAATAQAIANGREIIFLPELMEWNLGEWQGKSLTEIKEKYPEEHKLYFRNSIYFRPSGGESRREFRDRAELVLDIIAKNHDGQTVLCVTHGGFMRAVLLTVMDMEKYPAAARIDNTSISCFKTADAGKTWQLITWNDHSHLNGDMVFSSGW